MKKTSIALILALSAGAAFAHNHEGDGSRISNPGSKGGAVTLNATEKAYIAHLNSGGDATVGTSYVDFVAATTGKAAKSGPKVALTKQDRAYIEYASGDSTPAKTFVEFSKSAR